MKKLVAALSVLALLLPFAYAETSLSDLSFTQLIDLRRQIDEALWACEEWQEVEVPIGTYVIGEDIPAGKWTLECLEWNAYILLYSDLDHFTSKDYDVFNVKAISEGQTCNITLEDGNILDIQLSPVKFTPFVAPNFIFK